MNPSKNLTDLPLEVLGLIFKELPSLNERISLAQVHPHIGSAFAFHNSKSLKKLKMDYLNTKELSVVLQLCGSTVNHIRGSKARGDELKLVQRHCPNLQCIKLVVWEENLNGIKSLLANRTVRTLRSVTLNTDPAEDTRLGIVKLLKYQPSLERLHLLYFCGDELFEVRNLVNLEELIIDHSSDESLNLHDLCYRLKKLRKLHVQCASFTAPKEVRKAPCPALTEIKLCKPDAWFDYDWRARSIPATLRWILSHAKTLEVLHLSLSMPYGEPDPVICRILSECKRLRKFYWPTLTEDPEFAHLVVEIVSKKGKPMKLDFGNKRVHDQIRKLIDKTAAKDLITLGDRNYF